MRIRDKIEEILKRKRKEKTLFLSQWEGRFKIRKNFSLSRVGKKDIGKKKKEKVAGAWGEGKERKREKKKWKGSKFYKKETLELKRKDVYELRKIKGWIDAAH